MKDLEYFAFGFAAIGLLVMSVGLILGRRRNRI
jgi:LPXTG-motif cell wall-anchored protein